MNYDFFTPLWKKRAYCWSLCRSSNVHSCKFLNLLQWMPLESRCSYWFSGHMVKSQGQTIDLCTNDVYPNIFWTLYLKVTKLGTVNVPSEWMTLLISSWNLTGKLTYLVQVIWSKVNVTLLIFILSVVYSISFDPLLDCY